MKKYFHLLLVLGLIFFFYCDDDNFTKSQYVISFNFDNDETDPDWFKVVNIKTNNFQQVPAIKELNGDYYLPTMSRWPTFHNKVVEGEFYIDKPLGSPNADTVFKVTKHLRDTTQYIMKR